MPDILSTPKGAVFLSYASQDAEAARSICEALRAAGVEVWFDQSELRGGDAWDQSIRKQIKNCALFIPVISAHTQTRLEGYFRLEWKLAEDRSHLMAKGKAFIVPVTVDGTGDQDAQVPDAFLAVQWTKLPGGDTPTTFAERVKKLLAGPSRETEHQVPGTAGQSLSRPPRASRTWIVPVVAGVIACLALATWQPWRKGGESSQPAQIASSPSEAEQLVARVWEELNKTELGPDELGVADGFCKRATEIDPENADAWAAWSQVDSWYIYHNFDSSIGRRDAARSCAARALKLAPSSYEARLAQSCYLIRGATTGTGLGQVSPFAPEANRLLRQLLGEKPDEPRALFALAILERNLGHLDQARTEFSRLANNPQFSATAWSELAWIEYQVGSPSAAEIPLARSLALQPFWGNLGLKVFISLRWRGDISSARAAMDELPATVLQTDFGVTIAYEVFTLERKPDDWLRFSSSLGRDWIQSNGDVFGPIAAYNGDAHAMAGRREAARIEWKTALKQVEHHLADLPNDGDLLFLKGKLLARLGDYAESEKTLNLSADFSGRKPDLFDLKVAEGQLDAAMDILESMPSLTAAGLRLDPYFDPLRNTPRFKALLARAEADPKMSPQAPKANTATVSQPASRN
jgi:tetratricopeptide (TPR) repeat protein